MGQNNSMVDRYLKVAKSRAGGYMYCLIPTSDGCVLRSILANHMYEFLSSIKSISRYDMMFLIENKNKIPAGPIDPFDKFKIMLIDDLLKK
jgi:hypothetical protein